MSRRIGQVYLGENPERPALPEMKTHAQWCRWLAGRNSLKPDHRRCVGAARCVAPPEARYLHRPSRAD